VSNVLGISPRFEITAAPLAVGEAGASFALHGAQPNPGRGLTVSFSLRDAAPARLAVYDIGGREVVRRDIGAMGAGRHTVVLARSGALSPGIYLIRLTQSGRERVARAIVTR
jgi:hypothetical protein